MMVWVMAAEGVPPAGHTAYDPGGRPRVHDGENSMEERGLTGASSASSMDFRVKLDVSGCL